MNCPPAWANYQLFGLDIASNFPFSTPLCTSTAEPRLKFYTLSEPAFALEAENAKLIFSRAIPSFQIPECQYYQTDSFDILRFIDLVDFYLSNDQICYYMENPVPLIRVENLFLSIVMPFWLERRGIIALHASAIAYHGLAVSFLSNSGNGKSTLAASFLQAGGELLCDDIAAVELRGEQWIARPGYPQMKMWPEEAQFFTGGYKHLHRVSPTSEKRRVRVGENFFGKFCHQSAPLHCFYIPNRIEPVQQRTVEIHPVSPRDAVLEFVRFSFVARMIEAAGYQPQRLSAIAQLAKDIPVQRVSYPSGLEYLPQVKDAIIDDLEIFKKIKRYSEE